MLQVAWVTDMGSARSNLQAFAAVMVFCLIRKYPRPFWSEKFTPINSLSSPNLNFFFPLLNKTTGTTESLQLEVEGKNGGVAELECSFPTPDQATESSTSPHVVEWVRQGLDIPVLIKFGSYAPRVHPQYEGEHPWSDGSWCQGLTCFPVSDPEFSQSLGLSVPPSKPAAATLTGAESLVCRHSPLFTFCPQLHEQREAVDGWRGGGGSSVE